ncbi:MAG: hypothetical protein EPN22_12475 [Nitrospirae bacterium]|nr:MAG: hypothetical protein EPN22_12475 [Nitrospirota bacterium]
MKTLNTSRLCVFLPFDLQFSHALEVEMWEMFDFGHVATHKELKDSLQSFAKSADESSLRLASKLIRAVSR